MKRTCCLNPENDMSLLVEECVYGNFVFLSIKRTENSNSANQIRPKFGGTEKREKVAGREKESFLPHSAPVTPFLSVTRSCPDFF